MVKSWASKAQSIPKLSMSEAFLETYSTRTYRTTETLKKHRIECKLIRFKFRLNSEYSHNFVQTRLHILYGKPELNGKRCVNCLETK